MYINITVIQKSDKAFLKLCPKAIIRYRTCDNDFMYYKITANEYMRNAKLIDDICTVYFIKGTNCVKITGMREGQPIKLFIRETQVYKVLDKLTKDKERPGFSVDIISVSMRKVKIDKRYDKILSHIVLKSLAFVGIAA